MFWLFFQQLEPPAFYLLSSTLLRSWFCRALSAGGKEKLCLIIVNLSDELSGTEQQWFSSVHIFFLSFYFSFQSQVGDILYFYCQ